MAAPSSSSSSSAGFFGRAPWYETDSSIAGGTGGELVNRKPFIIGVTGGTASGKTTVCDEIVARLGVPWVVNLSMDRFYKSLTHEQRSDPDQLASYNFDHPNAFDFEQFRDSIRELGTSKSVRVPKYCFKTHRRLEETDTFYGADVVIVEGILSLYSQDVRDLFDLKIFVDCDDDVRLARRIGRDIRDRGRTLEDVLSQYLKTVKPAHDEFIAPTKRFADIIIPRGGENTVAIDLLVQHIRRKLEMSGLVSVTPLTGVVPMTAQPDQLPPNVRVLPRTDALKALHTIIRDARTDMSDFQFHLHRLARLVFTEALSLLPITDTLPITTPTSRPDDPDSYFPGPQLDPRGRCTVSIVRSGEPLEEAIRDVDPDMVFGKLVIQQSAQRERGPRLYYCKFPRDVASRNVFLLDAQCATGNVLLMAIRVLLDHHVPPDQIYVVCLLTSAPGLQAIYSRFPTIRFVTSWIEDVPGLDSSYFLTPGMGSIADRYFGTTQSHHPFGVLAGTTSPSNPSRKASGAAQPQEPGEGGTATKK